ncbi:uncharacterized protein LOC134278078 [Saccostrea cucullata]|uniref:uncharacterized protein LOC134278078 n=1 Tax=Saccostrea cuccullata TaxID=36930 RepID=UPI002ED08089
MDMIKQGIEAGNKIAELLADQDVADFGASLIKISGKVTKYLEAFSPVLGLFQMLLPDDQSNEIEEGFARMDAKFDQLFNRIDDLGDEQQKISLKTQFGAYEKKITLFSKRLDDYLKSKGKSENIFMETYDNKTFDENVRQLYMAMIKPASGPLSDSIPALVREFTNENRKDTEMVMKRILHLIIQGAAIEMAYYSLTDDEERYNKTKHDWEEKIFKLIDHIREIDEDMRYNYMDQVKEDISVLSAKMYGRSNKDFADTLYKFLSQKYEWRKWVVVVFNADVPNKIRLAQNAIQQTPHGRNVIVASSSKDREPDISNTKRLLKGVPSGYRWSEHVGWWERAWHFTYYDANQLFNKIPGSILGSSDYTVGVVRKYRSDLAISGAADRYALVSKQNYMYETTSDNLRAEDVRFWMFAIFTDKEVKPVRDDET